MTKYYKFLTEHNTGAYSEFDYSEYLPKGNKPGKWLPKVEKIVLCSRGYHACKKADVLDWLNAQMCEVELRGETIEGATKIVAQQMRIVKKITTWNDKTARLAACDIAETVTPIWNKYYPNDNRPQACIDAARNFANGNGTAKEMAAARAAAWDAASDADSAAAGDAARDAAWAAAGEVNKKIIYKYMGI